MGTKYFKTNKPTIEEIMRLRKPNQVAVEILMLPELKHQLEKLAKRATREQANKNKGMGSLADKQSKLEEETNALLDEIEAATATFIFQDIGRKKYDDLVAAHTPDEETIAKYKREVEAAGMTMDEAGHLQYDPETFPVALIAACAFEPTMTKQEAQTIVDTWSEGDIEAMFFGAIQACKERTSLGFTRPVTEETGDSEESLTTAPKEESPTESSLAGTNPTS